MEVSEITVSYSNKNTDRIKITGSETAYDVIIKHWDKNIIEFQEEVKLILLNRANIVLGVCNLSKGGVSGCIVDIKIILSISLKCNASGIIIVHNHPSGNMSASKADLSITKRLKEACEIVDLSLLDHLIISKDDYLSMSDRDLL